jgi:hypothetical protein
MASSAFLDLGNVILEPAPTLARLKDRPSPWIPLLAMILLSVAATWWWVSTEDFAWLREHMLSAQLDAKPEVRAAMTKFLTPTAMLWTAAIGNVVGTLVLNALLAAYYLVAARLMGSAIGYGKWFGFAAWISVPRLLVLPLMALQILTSHGQLAPEDINMTSLNYLLFHLPLSNPWQGLAANIDLATVWSGVLAFIGLKAWTGRSTGSCALAAALPYVIVYGLWAAKNAIFG